jgi:hypothetical protein
MGASWHSDAGAPRDRGNVGNDPLAAQAPGKPNVASEPVLPVPSGHAGLTLHLLRRQFPGVPMWYGLETRRFWALLNGQLYEAPSVEALSQQIRVVHALT